MRRMLILAVVILMLAAGCGDDSTGSAEDADPTAGSDDATSESTGSGDAADADAAASGSCGEPGFAGTVSSEGDDSNSPFTLTDGEVRLVEAFALQRGVSYTVYLADYDLGDQVVGSDTIEAEGDQVVITVFVTTPDAAEIVVDQPYEMDFVIMDSGGGASGAPVDPMGTVTFNGYDHDRVCFDIEFSDAGQVLEGTVSAEVVGGF